MSNEDNTTRVVEFHSPSTKMSSVVLTFLLDAFSSYHDELDGDELTTHVNTLKSHIANNAKQLGNTFVMPDFDDLGWYTFTPQS